MPNWFRGNLVVKGTKDDVKRFFLEVKDDDLKVFENDKGIAIVLNKLIYIPEDIGVKFVSEETIKECIMDELMNAWSITPESNTQISKENEIDVCAIEVYGGRFTKDIIIQKGAIIIDTVISFILDFSGSDEEFIGKVPNAFNEDLSTDNWKPASLIDDLGDLLF